jgi:hypothetical protein
VGYTKGEKTAAGHPLCGQVTYDHFRGGTPVGH